jgi:hypothetical protein
MMSARPTLSGRKSREVTVSQLEGRVSSARVPSLDSSRENLRPFCDERWPGEDEFRGGLSFFSVRSANGIYPDTGESGEAYDAEASLDRGLKIVEGFVDSCNPYCELSIYIASQYNQWDD